MQTALQKFHEDRMTYAPQDVHALLQTLVCSACKDHARRTRAAKRDCRKTFLLEDGQFADGSDGNRTGNFADPKADPRKQETKMDVDAAVAALTPEQAQAVRLDMAGHSHESAAEVTGISPEGQRRRLYSARRRIKEFLTPSIILLALIGSLADNCDPDVNPNLVTAETDEDEVCREDGGHNNQSDKLRRKSLERLPLPEEIANMTIVVNARHEDYDVLIARPSKWGNPFQVGRNGSRERVIQMYEVHIRRRPDLLAALPELAGKRLGCYCKPEACHGDVLVKLLRELLSDV